MTGILEAIAKALRSNFPSLEFALNEELGRIEVPANNAEFGPLVFEEFLENEVILYLGHYSHRHIEHYEEGASQTEIIAGICDQVIAFLPRVLNDEIVVWSSRRGGGHCAVADKPAEHTIWEGARQFWVWSKGRITSS